MAIPTLPRGSYSYLSEEDKVKFCARIRSNQLALDDPRSPASGDHFDRSSAAEKILLEELRMHVFNERVFSDQAIRNLIKTLWANSFVRLGPGGIIGQIFETSLILRECVLGEGEFFVEKYPYLSLDLIAQLALGLGSIFKLEKLFAFWNSLPNYPRLWNSDVLQLMIGQLVNPRTIAAITTLDGSISYIFPNEGIDFYFRAWDRFGVFDKFFWNSTLQGTIYPGNFIIENFRVLNKFEIADGYSVLSRNLNSNFKKGLLEIIQIGIYLKAMDDGLGELSMDSLCDVYGVDSQ